MKGESLIFLIKTVQSPQGAMGAFFRSTKVIKVARRVLTDIQEYGDPADKSIKCALERALSNFAKFNDYVISLLLSLP